MILRKRLFKELIKKGYAKKKDRKIWDLFNLSFLYSDKKMLEGFLKLREHPRYRTTVINIELDLLKKHIKSLLECKKEKINIIHVVVGGGLKIKTVFNLLNPKIKVRYCPVNVSKDFINFTLKNIKREKFRNIIKYKPKIINDLYHVEEISSCIIDDEKWTNVIFLLGSLLSAFQMHDYLFKISQIMLPGDILIIGNGIRRGKRFVNLKTYKHPLFNNWFFHLIETIGLKEEDVEYDARFTHERVECFYRMKKDKDIFMGRRKIQLKKNDELLVACLYKYYLKELKEACQMYFSKINAVHDPQYEYTLLSCKK